MQPNVAAARVVAPSSLILGVVFLLTPILSAAVRTLCQN